MPRKPRIDYPRAYHHVVNRGRNRQAIYGDDSDRRLFLQHLATATDSCSVEVHAYALMGNHYHLLLRSLEGRLSDAMQILGSRYTQDLNAKHGFDGAIFKGRFHSKLIDSEHYLLESFRYVVNNPVKAGLVERAEQCVWSSYRSTLGIVETPPFLKSGLVDEYFGTDLAQLDAFVSRSDTTSSERYSHVFDSTDSSTHLSQAMDRLDEDVNRMCSVRPRYPSLTQFRDELRLFVQDSMGVSTYGIASPNTSVHNSARLMFLVLLLDLSICDLPAVADALGCTPAAARRKLAQFRRDAANDSALAPLLAKGHRLGNAA